MQILFNHVHISMTTDSGKESKIHSGLFCVSGDAGMSQAMEYSPFDAASVTGPFKALRKGITADSEETLIRFHLIITFTGQMLKEVHSNRGQWNLKGFTIFASLSSQGYFTLSKINLLWNQSQYLSTSH